MPVSLACTARDYTDAVQALPAMQAWVVDGMVETGRIGQFERDE